MSISEEIFEQSKKLEGPVAVFGAGGFIGANLFLQLISTRNDVYAITSKPFIPWRLSTAGKNILHCDITKKDKVEELFNTYGFKTIFNLAAYGAYSNQDITEKIYQTNLFGLLNLLEAASRFTIKSFVHSGTSSEYGLNSKAPHEDEVLLPNSHYAVSKVASAHLIKYYGIIKELPVVNLRYYSVYGPYEDPDRLIPKLIQHAMNGKYPSLVQPDISRDFIFVDDAILAALMAANGDFQTIRGLSINIASGDKTTIREVVHSIRKLFNIEAEPVFGSMPDRKWDLIEWYGNAGLAQKLMGWKNKTSLTDGLQKTYNWQKEKADQLYVKKNVQDKIRHKLTAVIACYKDVDAIPVMYERLSTTFNNLNVDYEIIFVNDSSPDDTNEVLRNLVNKDEHVIAIEHSRNFGSQSAFL
ncbi:MAG: NAD-dependent epimerase/dehydratase family protein, partial [Ginsengibacter sp.]